MDRRRAIACLLAALVLAPAALAQQAPRAASTGRVERLSDSLAQRLFAPFLREGERLELPAFAAPIGPAPRTLLAVTGGQLDGESRGGFRALVLTDSAGAWRAIRVPPFEPDLWGAQLLAVLFENVDADPDLETIVLATYGSGIGPEGAVEWPHGFVLDWNGTAFVRLPDLERRIAGLETAAAIRRVLRARPR